jgi:class 3 adenylate cyclase
VFAFFGVEPGDRPGILRPTPVRGGVADLSGRRGGAIAELKGDWANGGGNVRDRDGEAAPTRTVYCPARAGVSAYEIGLGTRLLASARRARSRPFLRLRVGHTLSACEVLVNGRLLAAIGTPGADRERERPRWDSIVVPFAPNADGTAEIVLRVSNHRDRFGGSNASLLVGEAALLHKMQDVGRLTAGFTFAMLGIMGLFFLALFAFRKKDVPFFWFGSLCMTVAIRTLCYDEFVLSLLIPSLPWSVFFRLGYLTFPLAIGFFIGFLRALYPNLLSRRARNATAIVFGVYAAIIVGAPTFVAAILLLPFQILGLAAVGLGCAVIVRAVSRREEGAFWMLAGFSSAALAFVYDVLVSMWVISGFSVSHLGMSVCLFCLALMVIERYSVSFKKEQQVSRQLQVVNRSLTRFVPHEFLAYLKKESIVEVGPGDNVDVDMAVLAADIRSFTSLAERMSPTEVFRFLNEYLELVGPIIRFHGGFIARYVGDGFLALFPNGAEPALRAAIQMQSAVSARNRNESDKSPISIGIGLDVGKITLGTIGDRNRMDGAVLSSCVKSAEQLEQATKYYKSRIWLTRLSSLPCPIRRPIFCDGRPNRS